MKTNNKISAYILRGGTAALFFSCVIVALCSAINLPEQLPKALPPQDNAAFGVNAYQSRTLSFADRVAFQRVIEDVYWRHRIWPDTNADPKPPLDAVMSQAEMEKKVTDYLRNSHALEDYWQRPISVYQLQTEMERMASHTKQPQVLRELFEALGNDPFVIAECLARPVLTERLIADVSAQHQTGRLEHASATALHHYAFDGPGVVDSVGTANGTLLNGASVSAGQLHLDGVDDYVQFQEDVVPTVGDFSVAFFAQEVSPQADYTEIISQGFSGGPGFYVGYDPSHNFRIGDLLLSTGIPFPSDGFLHHYAVTAGTDTQLYIDGTPVATFDPIFTTAGGSHTRLGRQFDPFAEFFNGNLDDLWVFSGTLTADEVAALAAANSTPTPSPTPTATATPTATVTPSATARPTPTPRPRPTPLPRP